MEFLDGVLGDVLGHGDVLGQRQKVWNVFLKDDPVEVKSQSRNGWVDALVVDVTLSSAGTQVTAQYGVRAAGYCK